MVAVCVETPVTVIGPTWSSAMERQLWTGAGMVKEKGIFSSSPKQFLVRHVFLCLFPNLLSLL